MSLTIFTGCSYTEGTGLEYESCDENLWVNIVHSAVFSNTELLNLGKAGSNNTEIFKTTIDAISTHKTCKYLFVAWTELKRLRVNPGVELYNTNIVFSGGPVRFEVGVNPGINYSKKYLANIKNRFFDLQHDHHLAIEIFEYSKIIKQVCDILGITVFFVNNLLPWDKDYFDQNQTANRSPSDTTEYTQSILNAKTRSDEEYFAIYDKVHAEYNAILPATQHNWLNLRSGFRKYFLLDRGNDNVHPGILSNQAFSKHLIENLARVGIK